MNRLLLIFLLVLASLTVGIAQAQSFKIAKLKYNGGGDWYANKTSLPNLIRFCNQNLNMNMAPDEEVVEVGSPELFSYPFVHMTGHGNVAFSAAEAQNLRTYLLSGGFLHIDDNYGLDQFIRKEMKKVFPEYEFVELPFDHPIYKQKYAFPGGLPKIHEHDNKPPQGFGIIHEGRLVCFYTYETDLGNGWEDQEIYNDPEPIRQQALRMGANILTFALTQE
ncbi:DUF4159 domain-containing protein [Pontibacter kalidii]|uniref:DUF4159 domain-containing protein n=1 Tax=Pontibacter kalidii TaxID=2592049 RepID=UPI00225A4013|nr:DUF4159 domain-containing protein [Pontibacter kalidii]